MKLRLRGRLVFVGETEDNLPAVCAAGWAKKGGHQVRVYTNRKADELPSLKGLDGWPAQKNSRLPSRMNSIQTSTFSNRSNQNLFSAAPKGTPGPGTFTKHHQDANGQSAVKNLVVLKPAKPTREPASTATSTASTARLWWRLLTWTPILNLSVYATRSTVHSVENPVKVTLERLGINHNAPKTNAGPPAITIRLRPRSARKQLPQHEDSQTKNQNLRKRKTITNRGQWRS